MAMAMVMMSSERKPPSMPPSQDEAHIMIGDFTEITVSKFRQWPTHGTSYECETEWSDAGHSGSGDMEDGVTLDVPSFSSLYICTSLDLGPVQMASAWVFTTSGDRSSGGGVFPCTGSAEWLPYGTDRLWDLWVRTFAYVEQLFHCYSFLLLYGIMQPRGSAPTEGDNVMARLHVTCPGPGITRFI